MRPLQFARISTTLGFSLLYEQKNLEECPNTLWPCTGFFEVRAFDRWCQNLLSFATTAMDLECLDSISHLDDLDPSQPRALRQLCSCPAISSHLGFVI